MEHRAPVRLALSLVLSLSVSACGGGGGSPSVTPTPTPTASPSNEAAFQCPTSDAVASVARGGSGELRRAPLVRKRGVQTVAGLIAVSYARQTLNASRTALTAREQTLGATLVRELDFPHVGLTTRVLSVSPSQVSSIEASLRTQAGVRGVGAVARRYSTTAAPYYPNDPYFQGFMTGSSPPTFEKLPYVENQTVPGQWGMHAIWLEHAFGYSQSVGNTTGAVNPNALGLRSIRIAMIDTGQDTTHPELASKITYQKCFITDPNNSQSTSNFTTDQDGHGTDTAGIAAAALGNGVGFSGAGGNSVLYGYRVYPTPDDNCLNGSTTDDQCTATTMDIASAIDDAIAQHVNVISMSLGGGSCSSPGVDEDPTEGAAVAEAIANNIIVVAAAGNQTGPPLDAPACDSGVIAAGATAL
ncbi:MAG: S8 family serine peptidase, partial [Vulcanimicrobiaceae bacterium]